MFLWYSKQGHDQKKSKFQALEGYKNSNQVEVYFELGDLNESRVERFEILDAFVYAFVLFSG